MGRVIPPYLTKFPNELGFARSCCTNSYRHDVPQEVIECANNAEAKNLVADSSAWSRLSILRRRARVCGGRPADWSGNDGMEEARGHGDGAASDTPPNQGAFAAFWDALRPSRASNTVPCWRPRAEPAAEPAYSTAVRSYR